MANHKTNIALTLGYPHNRFEPTMLRSVRANHASPFECRKKFQIVSGLFTHISPLTTPADKSAAWARCTNLHNLQNAAGTMHESQSLDAQRLTKPKCPENPACKK